MHQFEKSVFITVVHVWSNETRINTEMNMAFSFVKLWLTFSVHLKSVFFCMRVIIDIIKLKKFLMNFQQKFAKSMKLCTFFTDLRACQFMIVFIFWEFICMFFLTFRMNFRYLIDLTSNSHLSMSICRPASQSCSSVVKTKRVYDERKQRRAKLKNFTI